MSKRVKLDLKNLIVILTAMLCVAVFVLLSVLDPDSYLFLDQKAPDPQSDYIKVIDVGQGDSILIQSNGYTALVDTGPEEKSLELCEALRKNRISSIDVLILTHTHLDHVGGAASLLEDFKVSNLVLPELPFVSEGLNATERAVSEVKDSGGRVVTAQEGFNFMLGEFEITVIAHYKDYLNENNRSLVLMVKKEDRKMLLASDLETAGEKRLLRKGVNVSCDVLKIGHHGSSTSSVKSFLSACNPKIAVISCGKNNEFAHPHTKVLKRLKNHRIKVYRTDTQGDITFFFRDNKISVETEN